MSNSYKSLVSKLLSHKAAKTDLAKVIDSANLKYGFAESTLTAGESYGVDFDAVFSLPQKQIMRAVQMINALATASYKHLDYTHARILCAMKLAGSYDLNTDAIIALAGAIRTDSANTRGISYSALNKMFASVHAPGTVRTKVSNSTGKNGIYTVMGMTWGAPGERNHTVSLNSESALVKRFFDLINNATTGQLEELIEGGK